jgi:hypothetical protein
MISRRWIIGIFFLFCCLWTSILASSDDSEDDDSLEATNVILFLFFGLGLGVLVYQMLSLWGEAIPYTVIIFILGALFALADSEHGEYFII